MMIDGIKQNLDMIKSLAGVENAVLTQRDGNPITSSGVWLSKNEIFHVSAATSAIYNVGLSLHGQWMKYMVIEGVKAKIMIAPVISQDNLSQLQYISEDAFAEYFLALTTLSSINLGSLFLKTQSTLNGIANQLESSNISYKPPLRDFNEQQVQLIVEKFNSKQDSHEEYDIPQVMFGVDYATFKKCEDILWTVHRTLPDLIYSSISFKGGFVLTSIQPSAQFTLTPDAETALSFSLFDTATRYAWLLKRMNIQSIFMDCQHYLQFIYGFNGGIISSYVAKNDQKIGLFRLMLPKYVALVQKILEESPGPDNSGFGDMIINPLMIK